MKKIVALVLAMVMVLGLATTAFAATAGGSVAGAQYNFDWNVSVTLEDAEDAKDSTFATYTIEAVATKDDVTAFWATLTNVEKGDKEDVEIAGNDEFVKVATEELAQVVVVDGKTITYYAIADLYEDGFVGKATEVELPVQPVDTADWKCNTLYAATLADTDYYFFENTLWYYDASSDDVLNVGGVAVPATKIVDVKANTYSGMIYNAHDFQIAEGYLNHTTLQGGAKWGVTKVYCDNCKAEFKFVETDNVAKAIAAFGQANYEFVTNNGVTVAIEKINPAIPGASAGTAAGDAATDATVESPKTFDAGIAMYVGMSVMAAAGSAVVLKKKD